MADAFDPNQHVSSVLKSIAEKSRRGGAHKPRVDVNGYVLPFLEQSDEYRAAHPELKPTDG